MITTNSGQTVALYEYDAYGRVESVKNALGSTITDRSHIGSLNPMRYRGYCYDNETGLYDLISRYYDPITGRFVNADVCFGSASEILSFNLFIYCVNNAITLTIIKLER